MMWQMLAANMRLYRLQAVLCVLCVALSVALIVSAATLSHNIQSSFVRNAGSVDMVAGASGSKLQLVLSSLYHADVPTGNISADTAEAIAHHPYIKKAVPIALGDNYLGFRLVGTNSDFLELYGIAKNTLPGFHNEGDVLAGSATGLAKGETFQASHGLSTFESEVHEAKYEVVAVMPETGTVLDHILLTSIPAIQHMHEHHHDHEDEGGAVTALLLQVKSPMAMLNLPRIVSAKYPDAVVASPALEMARLSTTLGFGRQVIWAVGGLIGLLAVALITGILYATLHQRRYDLTVMRVLGMKRSALCAGMMLEGASMAFIGAVLGIIMGHVITASLWSYVPALANLGHFVILPAAWLLFCLLVTSMIGFVVAALPALRVMRGNIADTLCLGRLA